MITIRKLVARNFNQIRTLKTPKYIKVNIEDTFNFHQEDPNKINWENVRKDLLNGRNVNEKNIDGIIVGFCSRVKRLDLAKSYFDFIKSQNYLPSDGASAKYLRSIWSHKQANKSFQINHDEINNICDNLVKRNKFLHPELADNIITGYCSTKYWLKSFDIIDKLKKDEIETGPAIYSPIISAAIENNDLKLVWKLIDKVIEENSAPSAFRVLEFFDKFYDNVNEIEKMLSIISELNMIFSDELVNQFKEIFDRKFDAKIVNIKRNGICHSCHSKLPSVDLNREEFEKLSKNFHEEVFVRKDVFCQTTPKELERFKNFVEKTKPYHCVIDGLNVAYSHGNQNTTKFYSGNIVSVVQHFKKLNQNILVIGRQHMLKWPKVDIDYIKKNSHFFVAQDISKDDPFILYAALKSGPHTNIFTRDLMRQHSFLLDPESKKLFKRWQQQHQLKLLTTLTNREILIQDSMHFEMKAQKLNSHWHIPFSKENRKFTYETFDPPSQWLCLKL